MIIGCGGAGKSTLAKQLHAITGIEVIHLDQRYWKANWIEPEKAEWEKVMRELVERDNWIMDGNYGGTMEIRMARADLIIFLNRSRWLCLYRVLKRRFQYYGKTRPDMMEGYEERLSWAFLVYVYNYNNTRRPKILRRLKELNGQKEVEVLRNGKEIKVLLNKIKTKTPTENGTI